MAKKKRWRILFILLIIIVGIGLFVYAQYKSIFIDAAAKRNYAVSLYIPSDADYKTLSDSIFKHKLVADSFLFQQFARYKKLNKNVYGGHYKLPPDITISELVNKLAGGMQNPVSVTFNNIRHLEEFAASIDKQLELDSAKVMQLLNSDEILNILNTKDKKLLGYFIPNTYEFYWNISARDFFKRMKKEHEKFWNSKRIAKAQDIGFTPFEIIILASIVQEETSKTSEMDKIAGVYINRLKHGMLLQADPTLKYVVDDWSIQRVLNKHKEVDSPYNTYKNKGLPPGPICMPEPATIDQVLNYEDHDYFYFVASVDKPGFHNFSKTLRGHNTKANRYRHYLNQNNIYE